MSAHEQSTASAEMTLEAGPEAPKSDALPATVDVRDADGRMGVLAERMILTVLELTPGGCLLESNRPIDVGTVGRLCVQFSGRMCGDDIRVSRCQRIEGAGSRHQIGAEFILTRRPGRSSLRLAIRRLLAAGSVSRLNSSEALFAFEIRFGMPSSSGGA